MQHRNAQGDREMRGKMVTNAQGLCALAQRLCSVSLLVTLGSVSAVAADGSTDFLSGNLVVSRSVYDNSSNNVSVGMSLPPHCTTGCGAAISDGTYPFVWNNATVDSSFGITSKIFLDQLTPIGSPVHALSLVTSLEVPNSSQPGVTPRKDQLVTSFPSKSELALNLSTDGHSLTFLGYVAPINALDVSNANTPAIVDPTNPVTESFYRAVAQVDQHGTFHFTRMVKKLMRLRARSISGAPRAVPDTV
jgi:hypothetical protein